MELQTIKSNTTWQEASATINNNSSKINVAIMQLENATIKNKGYYSSEAALTSAIPSPSVGSKAYVGSSAPYAIYVAQNGAWVNSGQVGGDETLNIGEFQEAVKEISVEANEESIVINEVNFNGTNSIFVDGATEEKAGVMTTEHVNELNSSIKTIEQTFTDEQKKRACANIGVFKVDALTQDAYDNLVANGNVDDSVMYVIVEE